MIVIIIARRRKGKDVQKSAEIVDDADFVTIETMKTKVRQKTSYIQQRV